jgi:hypothetical protein
VVAAGMFAGGCSVEPSPPPTLAGPTTPVVVGHVARVALAYGTPSEIRIPVRVATGFHIQANPASNQFLVPLALELAPVLGFAFGEPVYPQSRPYRLEGTDEDLNTYEGMIEIVLLLTVTDAVPPGKYVIEGSLQFQACDSTTCMFPSSALVSIVVEVVSCPQ